MQLSIDRESLFKAVNLIFKAADKRHNMVILGNIKLQLLESELVLTASDLEVELTSTLKLPAGACIQPGSVTLPAIKLKDICKFLPEQSQINITLQENERCLLTSGKSRFILGTLPSDDYPSLGNPENVTNLTISRSRLNNLIRTTEFAMAIQDVRYYLTGMLFDVSKEMLTTVATDGHRLALARSSVDASTDLDMQAILPRKAVLELQRLLETIEKAVEAEVKKRKYKDIPDSDIYLKFGREFLQISLPFGEFDENIQHKQDLTITLTARLIDGKFPDYRRVIPSNTDKLAVFNQEKMANVLGRVAILSNEKSRGVVFNFASEGMVEIRANNAEQDEAVEMIQAKYQGEPMELSFNAAYLQDVLGVIQGDLQMHMSQSNASVLVNQLNDEFHQYVIMPMRI